MNAGCTCTKNERDSGANTTQYAAELILTTITGILAIHRCQIPKQKQRAN